MTNDYNLDDEFRIAEERLRAEDMDVLALQKPIKDVLDLAPLISVSADTLVSDAVQIMVSHRLGCLLITENDELIGLFSERDVLTKMVADNAVSDQVPISQLMTKSPDTLSVESPLVFALHRMSVGGYRHIPLVDEQNRPVAVVSMRDIVNYLVELHPNEVLNLPPDPDQIQWRGREGG